MMVRMMVRLRRELAPRKRRLWMVSKWRMGAVVFTMVWLCSIVCTYGAKIPRISPEQGLSRLVDGNQRFQDGKPARPGQTAARREAIASGQSPFAVIVSCSDSRVPPEIVFDQGLGDLFVVRVAGNTVTKAGLESIDFAIDQLGASLVVVLGHDRCGAVRGALDACPATPEAETKKLPEIFANICPAAEEARKSDGDRLSHAIDFNVQYQVKALEQVPGFKTRISNGSLKIVGARYNLRTGKVQIMSSGD
jgi:carbonic anhydrase